MVEEMTGRDYSKYSVLVVDDEPFARSLISRLLAKIGFGNIIDSRNGHDALSVMDDASVSVDLILCDLMMPDMDGIELVRHLSGRVGCPAIAFLSGADDAVLKAACSLGKARQLQVLGSISKPVRREDLATLLEKLVHESTPRARRELPKITEADLARGIEADELFFHYQPEVSVKNRQLVCVEALARWNHPELGLVFPDAFIGLAESGHLIKPMTEKLLEIGIRQVADWRTQGLETRMSINFSAAMLTDADLPENLSSLVSAYSLAPGRFTLEVTETGIPKDDALFMEIVTRLHMKGFDIAIDDFGTGHSSLLKLVTLPFSELKIDRAFVSGASRDATKLAILEAAVRLAKSLNLKVVAEGVEDSVDWDLLVGLECDLAQGYYLAKPMPAEELQKLAADWAWGAQG